MTYENRDLSLIKKINIKNMGWISYKNYAKKEKSKRLVDSRWVWFIGDGEKDVSLHVVSSPRFAWKFEVDGCEGEVSFKFWLFFTFYLTFSRVFPEWIYPREYNQFSDKEASSLRKQMEAKSIYQQDKLNEYGSSYYEVINKNKRLRRSHRTKENGWIRTGNREFGISFHNYMMWWRFWTNPDEWSSDTPKWRHGSFDFVKLLKGRDTVDKEEIFNGIEEIQMPEGKYKCKIEYTKYTRKYKRWWSNSWHRFSFEFGYNDNDGNWISTPIPHWGKGENSWDCGMDGTYSISLGSGINNLDEAKLAVVNSCLRSRERYGEVDFSNISGIEDGYVKENLIGKF